MNGYDTPERGNSRRRCSRGCTSTPGVGAAGLANVRILDGNQWRPHDRRGISGQDNENSSWQLDQPGLLQDDGNPLVAGRDFTERDERSAAAKGEREFRVAIVNERFARHYFGSNSRWPSHRLGRQPGYENADRDRRRRPQKPSTRMSATRPAVQVFFPYLEAGDAAGSSVSADERDTIGVQRGRRDPRGWKQDLPVSEMRLSMRRSTLR